MGNGIPVVGIGGVGTKDSNRYVVDITYHCTLPWFWKEYKAVNIWWRNMFLPHCVILL
jgi:hypothetical protein